jgi:branched-chain amino acid transport system ATP-binding protein
MLKASSVSTGYGARQVLDGVSLTVDRGEIVAILGLNGSGKSTLLKATYGLLPIWKGAISFGGVEGRSPVPSELRRRGVAYVPQGNRVFGALTVRDNLLVSGMYVRDPRQLDSAIDEALGRFPALRSRLSSKAGLLSGGERQMLALACGLTLSPSLVLLDEPSHGLAPSLVSSMFSSLSVIRTQLHTTILLVEQRVRQALEIADRVYVMRRGTVSFAGAATELMDDSVLRNALF